MNSVSNICNSDVKNRLGISLIGASNNHHALHEVSFVLGLKIDFSLLKTLEGFLDDTDRSFDNELSGVNLGLGLLDLQKTLGIFSMVLR